MMMEAKKAGRAAVLSPAAARAAVLSLCSGEGGAAKGGGGEGGDGEGVDIWMCKQ